MKILTRYVCNEILLNFEIALLTISSLMMIYQASRQIDNFGSILGLLDVIPLLIPSVLVFSIPLSILLATLLTFSRLANEGEVHAMYSCQIRPAMIASPVFILMIILSILSLLNSQFGVPWSFDQISKLKYKAIINLVLEKIKTEDQYIENDISYVKFQASENMTPSVLIRHKDKNGYREVVADECEATADYPNASIQLHLKNSRYFLHTKNEDITGSSDTSVISIPLKVKEDNKKLTEMGIDDLKDDVEIDPRSVKRIRKSHFERHRKLSASLSCLVLGLLGMFIGLRMLSGNKFVGILTALGLVMLIYLPLLTVGKWLAVDSNYSIEPWVGAWLPFMAITFITIFLKPSTKGV